VAKATELFRRVRRLFTILIPALALGCADLPGIIGPINDALGIVCETRAALVPAHAALDKGDVGAAPPPGYGNKVL